jgi:hypothetical protein
LAFLVQLLLPLYDNSEQRFANALFVQVMDELTDRYGGVTAYLRSPAEGSWREGSGAVDKDEVVMFEVMVDHLDRDWWSRYRGALEQRFAQEELVVRATAMERL